MSCLLGHSHRELVSQLEVEAHISENLCVAARGANAPMHTVKREAHHTKVCTVHVTYAMRRAAERGVTPSAT